MYDPYDFRSTSNQTEADRIWREEYIKDWGGKSPTDLTQTSLGNILGPYWSDERIDEFKSGGAWIDGFYKGNVMYKDDDMYNDFSSGMWGSEATSLVSDWDEGLAGASCTKRWFKYGGGGSGGKVMMTGDHANSMCRLAMGYVTSQEAISQYNSAWNSCSSQSTATSTNGKYRDANSCLNNKNLDMWDDANWGKDINSMVATAKGPMADKLIKDLLAKEYNDYFYAYDPSHEGRIYAETLDDVAEIQEGSLEQLEKFKTYGAQSGLSTSYLNNMEPYLDLIQIATSQKHGEGIGDIMGLRTDYATDIYDQIEHLMQTGNIFEGVI